MPPKKSAPKKSTAAKKSSGKKSKQSTSAPTTTPTPVVEVVAPPPAPAPVVEVTAPATEEVSVLQQIENDFVSLNERLVLLKTMFSSLTTDVRKLQKNMARHTKENSRKNKRKKQATGDKPKRAPSGFAKPARISTELCNFLGKPDGTEMARTEVTKYLTTYIKENELQDQANRRRILPDDKLTKLLNLQPADEVTYFNLQKYMKVHFPKPASATVSA